MNLLSNLSLQISLFMENKKNSYISHLPLLAAFVPQSRMASKILKPPDYQQI
jgi:hypothetical protein